MQVQNANPPIQVTGRHVSVTEAMKEYCRRRLACLHLDYPKIIEVQIIMDVQKYRHTAEVILHCSNHITLEASAESHDMYVSVDEVVDKIAGQMRKYKTRLMRQHRPRTADAVEADDVGARRLETLRRLRGHLAMRFAVRHRLLVRRHRGVHGATRSDNRGHRGVSVVLGDGLVLFQHLPLSL